MSIKEMFHLHKKKRQQVPAKFMRTIKTLKNDYHEQITTLEFQPAIQMEMLFQRPYISKNPGGACIRTPLETSAFGARDGPP